jgi:hypothetical protein
MLPADAEVSASLGAQCHIALWTQRRNLIQWPQLQPLTQFTQAIERLTGPRRHMLGILQPASLGWTRVPWFHGEDELDAFALRKLD